MTPLERQEQIDRWRARTLGTPVHRDIVTGLPTPGSLDALPPPEPDDGPVDRFVPLLLACITGILIGIAIAWLKGLTR